MSPRLADGHDRRGAARRRRRPRQPACAAQRQRGPSGGRVGRARSQADRGDRSATASMVTPALPGRRDGEEQRPAARHDDAAARRDAMALEHHRRRREADDAGQRPAGEGHDALMRARRHDERRSAQRQRPLGTERIDAEGIAPRTTDQTRWEKNVATREAATRSRNAARPWPRRRPCRRSCSRGCAPNLSAGRRLLVDECNREARAEAVSAASAPAGPAPRMIASRSRIMTSTRARCACRP